MSDTTRERGQGFGQTEWTPWRPPVCRRRGCGAGALDYTFQLCAGHLAEYVWTWPNALLIAIAGLGDDDFAAWRRRPRAWPPDPFTFAQLGRGS